MERAILHVVKRNNFFVLFWCIWQGKKYKWCFFSRKMTFRKEQNNCSFCSFCGESHSSCSQILHEQFFCPFLMHLARQKVQMTFFSRKVTFRKEQNNCSFCGESHSSCSQKEQFFCPFLVLLARRKVQITFFSRNMTFRKEQNNCSFCGESHSSCSQKEQFFCPFSDAFGKAKSTNDVLF